MVEIKPLRVDYYRKWQLDLEHHFTNFKDKEAPGLLNHQLQTIIDWINKYTNSNQTEVLAIKNTMSVVQEELANHPPIRFIRNIYNASATLTGPIDNFDGQYTIFCLINDSADPITVTLSNTDFRSGLAFPSAYQTTVSTTTGLDIVSSTSVSNVVYISSYTQAYLNCIYDDQNNKQDVLAMTYRYQNNIPPAFPPAWAYWKMEEASGNRIDSTGNGRHLVPSGDTPPDNAVGVIGNMAHFIGDTSGPGNKLAVAECWDPSGDKNFTYSFWVKSGDIPSTISGPWSFAINSNLSVTIQNMYSYYGIDAITVTVNTEDPWSLWLDIPPATYTLSPNVNHHFFIVYDGVGMYVYIDNALIASALGTHGMTTNVNHVNVGFPSYDTLESWVDEFGIWEVALTADQRAQLYNSGAGWSPY